MPTHGERWIAQAVRCVEKFGISVFPVGQDKVPAVKWSEYQSRLPSMDELLEWPKDNLGIVTGEISRLVVVDCESKEDARWFYDNRGKSPTVVKTKRGYHFYFKHPGVRVPNAIKVDDRYDVRGSGGYVLAPPSLHSEGSYEWHKPLIDPDSLPVFRMEWRPFANTVVDDKKYHDGVKYISSIRAISGSNGHNDTYRAACVLKDSGLAESEALLALQEWNRTNAEPQWSDRELLHKIRWAYCQDS